MGAMSSFANIPMLVDERTVMKLEVAERLYSEPAFIVQLIVLTLITDTIANMIFFAPSFAFSGLDWSHFWPFYVWQFLCSFAFDSLFQAMAAIAKTGEQVARRCPSAPLGAPPPPHPPTTP